jgi:hypothetical protein
MALAVLKVRLAAGNGARWSGLERVFHEARFMVAIFVVLLILGLVTIDAALQLRARRRAQREISPGPPRDL